MHLVQLERIEKGFLIGIYFISNFYDPEKITYVKKKANDETSEEIWDI